MRSSLPKAFHRNYAIRSIGEPNAVAVHHYVQKQVDHHVPADPKFEALLRTVQFADRGCDLATGRLAGHAQFWYNLHLVLVNERRWRDSDAKRLKIIRDGVIRVAAKRNELLAEAAVLPDHLHIVLGCQLVESPEEVALSYMNNLSWLLGGVAWFRPSYYVGTFGEYSLGAVRSVLGRERADD